MDMPIDLRWTSNEVFQGTPPPAGASFTFPNLAAQTWHLIGFRFQVTTDGTVTARHIQITKNSVPAPACHIFSPLPLAPSITYHFHGAIGYPTDTDFDALSRAHVTIPHRYLIQPGEALTFTLINGQAGDQIDAVELMVCKYLTD